MQEENMCEGILKVRHNVTEVSSIREFWGVRGGFDGNCKDVCFVRMTGQNDGYLGEVEQMDRQLSQQAAGGAQGAGPDMGAAAGAGQPDNGGDDVVDGDFREL